MEHVSSLKVFRSKVVVTDEHFFPIAVDDLVDALAGWSRAASRPKPRAPSRCLNNTKAPSTDRLSTENADKQMLKDFVAMVEGLHRHNFNQLQRCVVDPQTSSIHPSIHHPSGLHRSLLKDFRPFAVGATETRLLVTEKESTSVRLVCVLCTPTPINRQTHPRTTQRH